MKTASVDADWYNMCEAALGFYSGSDKDKWDKLKLVLAYTISENLCKYVAMSQYENVSFSWGTNSVKYEKKEDTKFFYDLLNEAALERGRYLKNYVCRWSDINEKLYNLIPVKRQRGKYIWS